MNQGNSDISIDNMLAGLDGRNPNSPYAIYCNKLIEKKITGSISFKGKNIYLNISEKVNETAYKALGEYDGAVIAYNYKTGQTVCQTSKSSDGSLSDKTISESFTPGSIMKIVTSISAIENLDDIDSTIVFCTGTTETKDGYLDCSGVHERVGFREAFAQSCNCFFAQTGIRIGNEKLYNGACGVGFNSNLSSHGVVYKNSFFEKNIVSETDLGWASIGQYTTLVTPVHFLTLVGAIANGGKGIVPDAVNSIGYQKKDSQRNPETGITLNPDTAEKLNKMMRSNVRNKYGDDRFSGLTMCGKTGTAQVDGLKSHSWFVGFSQDENFPYAIVCVAEYAGAGYDVAIDVSNAVLQYLADKQ